MESLSKKEVEVISQLEFDKKYFFKRDDIRKFFKNNQQISDFIYGLKSKKRIIRINRTKYYLIPMKAKSGSWSEDSFVIADEICNSRDYFIGGWAAANYWKLTDQMPMQIDIYTTRRQGKSRIMNARFVFHRTTKKIIRKSVIKKVQGHEFRVMGKDEAKRWMKSRK